jgi:hypothetical protein
MYIHKWVFICIFAFTYTSVYIQLYIIYIYIYIYIYMYKYICIHIYTYMYIRTYIYTPTYDTWNIHEYRLLNILKPDQPIQPSCLVVHIYVFVHTYTNTFKHIYIYISFINYQYIDIYPPSAHHLIFGPIGWTRSYALIHNLKISQQVSLLYTLNTHQNI